MFRVVRTVFVQCLVDTVFVQYNVFTVLYTVLLYDVQYTYNTESLSTYVCSIRVVSDIPCTCCIYTLQCTSCKRYMCNVCTQYMYNVSCTRYIYVLYYVHTVRYTLHTSCTLYMHYIYDIRVNTLYTVCVHCIRTVHCTNYTDIYITHYNVRVKYIHITISMYDTYCITI